MATPKPNYPAFTHRFGHLGDTAPPSLNPGGPTDPLGTRARVYIGDSPAQGWPPTPGPAPTTSYPTGTTMIGRNEEALDDAVNRALHALHEKVDSIGDRSRLRLKQIEAVGSDPASYWIELPDSTMWGPLDLDKLIYMGPPGSTANDIAGYTLLRSGDDLLRVPDTLAGEQIAGLWSHPPLGGIWPGPSPLYFDNLAMTAGGYYPDGDGTSSGYGVVYDLANEQYDPGAPAPWNGFFGKMRLADPGVPGAGPVSTVDMAGYCIFNYSLAQRIEQRRSADLWKAFAIVMFWVDDINPAPGLIYVNHDVTSYGADSWQNGDIVYRTNIALAPLITYKNTPLAGYPIVSGEFWVASAGWDRVQGTLGDPGLIQSEVGLWYLPPRIQPCLELDLPATVPIIGGHDKHYAFFRALGDKTRGTIAFETMRYPESAATADGKLPWADFANLEIVSYNTIWTKIAPDHWDNAFAQTNPGEIDITGNPFGGFFANAGNTALWTSSITLDAWLHAPYLFEVYDSAAPDAEPIGLWLLIMLSSDTVANAVRVDGEASGDGLPAAGYFRLLRIGSCLGSRLFMNWTGFPPIIEYPVSGGLRIMSPGHTTYIAVDVPNHAVTVYGDSDDDGGFAIAQRKDDGSAWIPFSVTCDGMVRTQADPATPTEDGLKCRDGFRCPGTEDYKYSPVKTGYHHVPLQAGLNGDYPAPFPTPWLYQHETGGPPDTSFWEILWLDPSTDKDAVEISFPVNVPHGCTITNFEVRYYQNRDLAGVTNLVPQAKLYRQEMDWGVPGNPPLRFDVAVANGTLTPASWWQVLAPVNPLSELVNNETCEYFAMVRSGYDDQVGVPLQQKIAGIRITFTMPIVAPA